MSLWPDSYRQRGTVHRGFGVTGHVLLRAVAKAALELGPDQAQPQMAAVEQAPGSITPMSECRGAKGAFV